MVFIDERTLLSHLNMYIIAYYIDYTVHILGLEWWHNDGMELSTFTQVL